MGSIAERITALKSSQNSSSNNKLAVDKPASSSSSSIADRIASLKSAQQQTGSTTGGTNGDEFKPFGVAPPPGAGGKPLGMGDMLKQGAASTSSGISARIAALQSASSASLLKEEDVTPPPVAEKNAKTEDDDVLPRAKQMGMGDFLKHGGAMPASSSSSSSLIASRIASLQSETQKSQAEAAVAKKQEEAAARELENAPVMARPVIPTGRRRLPSAKPSAAVGADVDAAAVAADLSAYRQQLALHYVWQLSARDLVRQCDRAMAFAFSSQL